MRSVTRASLALAVLGAAVLLALSTAHAQVFVREWGSPGSGPGQFTSPWGVCVDANGIVYVGDATRVQRFTRDGVWLGEFCSVGAGPAQLQSIYGLCVSPAGHVWVADPSGYRIIEFDAGGQYLRHIGDSMDNTLDGALAAPLSVTVDAAGNIYVVDFESVRVQKFDPSGQFVTRWNRMNFGFAVITADTYGHVFTGELDSDCVRRWSLDGGPLGDLCDLGPVPPGMFLGANGLATDATGNLYVTVGRGVRVFSPTGALVGRVGRLDGMPSSAPGEFRDAIGIAVSPDGAIYVVDRGNSRVQKFEFAPVPTQPTTWGRLKSLYR